MKAIWTKTQGRVPRRVRQFRPDDGLAEAGAEAASAGDRRRRLPAGARRAVRYGDGWIPLAGRVGKDGDVFSIVPKFREMLKAEAGRDPTKSPSPSGSPARELDLMKRYVDLGVERVVFNLIPKAPTRSSR